MEIGVVFFDFTIDILCLLFFLHKMEIESTPNKRDTDLEAKFTSAYRHQPRVSQFRGRLIC